MYHYKNTASGVRHLKRTFFLTNNLIMNKLKSPQQKANERYAQESIKPMYAFIIVCVAFLITAIMQNL
jgi:hypothetical protein